MRKHLFIVLIILLYYFCVQPLFAQKLKSVRIGILEALNSSDTVANERFRQGYEGSIYYSIGRNEKRLFECGYKFEVAYKYFDLSDKLSAKETAIELAKTNPWIVYGPRRSGHFLSAMIGLTNIPFVSSMANAKKVTDLSPPLFTMSHSLDEVSEATVYAINKEKFGNRYGSIVDGNCTFCRDSEKAFDFIANQRNFEKNLIFIFLKQILITMR